MALSWFQLIRIAEPFPRREILARTYELGDLANMADVVQRPFVEHLGERDLADFWVTRSPRAGLRRKTAQELDVGSTLLRAVR
jgi:hypothetical protein